MNEQDLDPADTELSARIATYELAFRMQSAAPEAVDLSRRAGGDRDRCTAWTTRGPSSSARGACWPAAWSSAASGSSSSIRAAARSPCSGTPTTTSTPTTRRCAALTDKPVAALLTDLKRTGLLDETLVVWGGEFGRTPVRQGGGRGRDHNATGFTMWMAGGGVKGGTIVGATDEAGLKAIEDRAHVNDIHATILHLMGLDHKQLTFLHNGRDERLTDVGGRVLKGLLA